MGLWRWARDVAVEREEGDPIPIKVERQPDGGYAFRLGVGAGFGGQEIARVPVHRRLNPQPHPVLKEVHSCEVAGQTLEAANVYALREKARALLETLAPAHRLPICWFRSPAMDYELPVYEQGGDLTCPVIGGPRIRASDLAHVRLDICRYLVSAGYVRDADEVEVGVLRPRDLRRVPPACVFRSQADAHLWLPSVDGFSPEGPVVGLLGPGPRLARHGGGRTLPGPPTPDPAPFAPDVVALLRSVRADLEREARRRGGSGPSPEAVYASQVRPDVWPAVQERTEDAGALLTARLTDDEATTLELGVRATGAGDVCAALEDRGINVFLAPDPQALARRLGEYLAGSGFLRFEADVEVRDRRAAPPERLDADSIATFGGGRTGRPRLAPEATEEAGGLALDTAGAAGPTKEVHDAWR